MLGVGQSCSLLLFLSVPHLATGLTKGDVLSQDRHLFPLEKDGSAKTVLERKVPDFLILFPSLMRTVVKIFVLELILPS